LRGLSIRALESFPDHPGLLLLRGVSEAMCSDANDSVSEQALYASLRASVIDYEIDSSTIFHAVGSLFELAGAKAPGLKVPLTFALYRLSEETVISGALRSYVRLQAIAFGDPAVRVIIAAFSLSRTRQALADAAERIAARWSPVSVRDLAGQKT